MFTNLGTKGLPYLCIRRKTRKGSSYSAFTNHKWAQVSLNRTAHHQLGSSSSNHKLSSFTTTVITTGKSCLTAPYVGIPSTVLDSTALQTGTNIKTEKCIVTSQVSVITRKHKLIFIYDAHEIYQLEAFSSSPCVT